MRMSYHTPSFYDDVIIYPCPNLDAGLAYSIQSMEPNPSLQFLSIEQNEKLQWKALKWTIFYHFTVLSVIPYLDVGSITSLKPRLPVAVPLRTAGWSPGCSLVNKWSRAEYMQSLLYMCKYPSDSGDVTVIPGVFSATMYGAGWRAILDDQFVLTLYCYLSQRTVTRSLMLPLICAQTNSWANNGDAGDLRRHRPHYDATAIISL